MTLLTLNRSRAFSSVSITLYLEIHLTYFFEIRQNRVQLAVHKTEIYEFPSAAHRVLDSTFGPKSMQPIILRSTYIVWKFCMMIGYQKWRKVKYMKYMKFPKKILSWANGPCKPNFGPQKVQPCILRCT